MRKKVEKKIRQAVKELGKSEYYRIDKVRDRAGVIPKLFDKTILDMARVNTIELTGGDTDEMNPAEINKLVRKVDDVYVYFSFLDDESEAEKIASAVQRSGELFDSGLFCAESVLLAIAEAKGIQSDVIPKIATGFCGGISRTCGMCGAVTGAIMAVNLAFGRNDPNASVEKNYIMVRKLMTLFEEKYGSANCKELIDCDLGTEEGRNDFKAKDLRAQCKVFIEEATRIAISLMLTDA
ncbi:MAG: C_GCAxxG_C_C family protein [Deltaproteobacteria bacterium]|nr:C_GCAxxG_C_C family protein [Deltaproteobacteria bacterium]